jgi:hypothetical protein
VNVGTHFACDHQHKGSGKAFAIDLRLSFNELVPQIFEKPDSFFDGNDAIWVHL